MTLNIAMAVLIVGSISYSTKVAVSPASVISHYSIKSGEGLQENLQAT